jgi:uncharacterized damage-inducible protein DinB
MKLPSELFHHNRWATLRLLEACEALDEAALDAAPGGTYGSIRATLVHLVAAEERYVSLLGGAAQPEPPLRESAGFPGFDRLRERAQRTGDLLAGLAETMPGETIIEDEDDGRPYTLRAVVPLIQALHHANEHRTQVCTTLTAIGVESPALGVWEFAEDTDRAPRVTA